MTCDISMWFYSGLTWRGWTLHLHHCAFLKFTDIVHIGRSVMSHKWNSLYVTVLNLSSLLFLIKVRVLSLLAVTSSTLKVRPNVIPSRGHRVASAVFGFHRTLLLTRSSAGDLTALSDTSLQTFKVHLEIHLKPCLLFGTHSCWREVDTEPVVRAFSWWRRHDCWPFDGICCCLTCCDEAGHCCVSTHTCFIVYTSSFLPFPVCSFICFYNIQYIFFYIYVIYLGVVWLWSCNQLMSMLAFSEKAVFTFLSE